MAELIALTGSKEQVLARYEHLTKDLSSDGYRTLRRGVFGVLQVENVEDENDYWGTSLATPYCLLLEIY